MTRPVVLVTGASRGIGREVALDFAARGFDIVLVARDAAKLADVAAHCRASGAAATEVVAVDLVDYAAAREACLAAVARLGRLDVLVNAAGIFRFGTSAASVEDLQAVLSANVLAIHNLCNALLDPMRRTGSGRIFNVSSITGLEPFAPVGVYAASKHALVGYGRSLARELLAEDIEVTTLCPDVVDTDMAAGSGMDPRDMIAPTDIARAIAFVMSLSTGASVDLLAIRCRPASSGPRAQG